MKKTLLAVLMVGAATLVITGCGKKEETKKLDVKGPRVVCTSEEKTDGIKVTDKVILKFDKDNYVKYQGRETTAKFDDKDVYKEYIKETENNKDNYTAEGVEYMLSKNAKENEYTTTLVYTEKLIADLLKDASSEDKKNYYASTILKEYENAGMECEYIEVSKADLGIK